MFQAGDKIFYPMHGAGVIEVIEEREVLNQRHLYYVVKMFLRDMQVMIPTEKIDTLGIRPVTDSDLLDHVLKSIHEDEVEPSTTVNTNQRQQMYMKKMKSGDIFEGAQVIRELICMSKVKPLGTGDKMMLDNAKQILISEVVLVKGIGEEQALDLLEQVPSTP